jgi:uncharacterized protein involved in exopolysaccharide biosynthesis
MSSEAAVDQEVNVRELADALLRSKVLIIVITAIFAGTAYAAARLIPRKYEATIIVSPVSSGSAGGMLGGLSSVASQFGGLASLAGITPQGDSKKAEAIAVLQSEALTQKYIELHDLLPVIYAPRWDAQKKQWNTTNPRQIPTLWKANLLFKEKIRSVSTDVKTGLTTMKIVWSDPVMAARWANDLVKLTNDFLRDKAIVESENNIHYLTQEVQRTNVVGVQQAIYAVLQNEISTMMLARGSDDYALKVIDPAFAPEKPSSPIPGVWVAVGAIVGLIVSCGVVFLRKT